ncbi:MAG: fasciclin domain-containing protein [Limibacillus sp.]|jgi:uncharacterized surface protein with fasciclin (FAS1) repeats
MIKFVSRTLAVLATVGIVSAVQPAAASGPAKPGRDIVETAVQADDFNTLVAAVQAAGLVETLQGEGPFTVFAPTDAAFAALPAGTVENLLKPENKDQLVAILTYHVVVGEVPSSAVANKQTEAKTVEGSMIKVNGLGSGVMINDANVVRADIITDNGLIHVIDKVLIPGM